MIPGDRDRFVTRRSGRLKIGPVISKKLSEESIVVGPGRLVVFRGCFFVVGNPGPLLTKL